MSRAAVLGALAGAAVTVAVYEGKARIGHADAATTLTAGQSTTVRGQAVWKGKGQPTLVRVKSPSDGDLDIELDPTNPGVAALMERIGVLEQELKAAHMAQAIQRGQLAQHTGDPVAWPKDVPEAWKPDVMEANLEAFIAEHPQMAIENIDCSEFPCVAVLSDPGDDLGDLPRQLAEQVFGKGTALSLARAKEADENGERGYLGVAAVPADMHAEDPNLSTRANYRSQLLMGELGDAAGHDEEHEE